MDRADVIIFGGGLVGLALAAALDASGLSAIVVDPADLAPRGEANFDGRTSAVSSSSMRMLETVGIADHLAEPGCPIWRIAVADGLKPAASTSIPTTMSRWDSCMRIGTCALLSKRAPRPARTFGSCGSRA